MYALAAYTPNNWLDLGEDCMSLRLATAGTVKVIGADQCTARASW